MGGGGGGGGEREGEREKEGGGGGVARGGVWEERSETSNRQKVQFLEKKAKAYFSFF